MQSATVNGSSITNDYYFPTKMTKGFMPSIKQSSFSIGNRDGVALGTPFYENLQLVMEILVKADSITDLPIRRDNLIKLFKLNRDRTQKTRTLRIIDNAGRAKSLDFVTKTVASEALPDRKDWCKVTVGLDGALEYYKGDSKEKSVFISSGGGFSIPFALPFDMSIGAVDQSIELVNNGNTESHPTVRVYGDMTSFNIVNSTTGEVLSCTESLGIGDYIDFDFYSETAVKNGVTNVLDKITGDWFSLLPGSNIISLATVSTSDVAHAEFTYFDAYLNL